MLGRLITYHQLWCRGRGDYKYLYSTPFVYIGPPLFVLFKSGKKIGHWEKQCRCISKVQFEAQGPCDESTTGTALL